MAILRKRKVKPQPKESGFQALRRKAGQHISPKWDHHDSPPGPPRFKAYGIINTSVYCYRNSLIQALFHVPKFANWLKFHHEDCRVKNCVACNLQLLLNDYWTLNADQLQDGRNWTVKELHRTMMMRNNAIPFGRWHREKAHQDPSELWSYLTSAFFGQLSSESILLQSMFQYVSRQTRTCPSGCPSKTEPEDYNNELRLNFPSDSHHATYTLPQLIHHTLGPSIREDFHCDDCGQPVNCSLKTAITAAPDILIVTLLRYGTMGHAQSKNYRSKRIEATVQFKQYMSTLTKYHEGGVALTYALVGVLMHAGRMDKGHFVTVAKRPRGSWYWVEDDVEPWKVGFEEAVSGDREDGMVPYMLFYKRVVRQMADI